MRYHDATVRSASKADEWNGFVLSGLCSFHFATPARLRDEMKAKKEKLESENAP